MSTSHDELAPLASAYALGALEPDERRSFERHAAECELCTAEARAFSSVVAALATSVPQVTPAPEVRDRVITSVRGTAVMPGVGTSVVIPAASGTRKSRITNRRSEMVWLPYAALLAVTVGLGGYTLSLRARVTELEGR